MLSLEVDKVFSQRTNLKIITCIVGRMWWKMVNMLRLKEADKTDREKISP